MQLNTTVNQILFRICPLKIVILMIFIAIGLNVTFMLQSLALQRGTCLSKKGMC